jgi:hypothetical protein
MTCIVDTNVAVVANERISPQASLACVDACIQSLKAIMTAGRIALDDDGEILEEYLPYMRWHGELGLGDEFFKWVVDNQWNTERCDRVPLAPYPEDPRIASFDLNDRKFVQVALAHPQRPPILNAVDSDWRNFEEVLARHGVSVLFLCSEQV